MHAILYKTKRFNITCVKYSQVKIYMFLRFKTCINYTSTCCLHSVWFRIFSSFYCLCGNWNSYMKLLGVVIVHCNKLQGPLNDKINLIICSKGAFYLSSISYTRWETSSSICQRYSWTKSGRVWTLKNYPILMNELGRNHKYSGYM